MSGNAARRAPERELTRAERVGIRALAKSVCANYDHEHGCLPLDCQCYMLGKWWTGSFCKYFTEHVLPLAPGLSASMMGYRNLKPCATCGSLFPPMGRQVYCTARCREKGLRQKDTLRHRKRRQNKG